MPRFLWRAAGIALAAALLPTTAGASVPSVPLAQRSPDDPLLAIDRVLDIDRVGSLRGADAFAAELAAAAVGGQAALAAAAAAAPSTALTVPAPGASGIPATVLAAYLRAEANLASTDPSCRLPWWVLAGIGRIESGHASGGRVDADGKTRGNILGPRLDGTLPGTAVIGDSDAGGLDGDPAFDRAVGPMQFLPGTWRTYARDGNADGRTDPHNIFDAATSAGVYLCGNGGDLSVPANLARAVFAYNPSQSYVDSVLSWGAAYRDGANSVADSAGTVPPSVERQPVVPAPKAPAPNRPPVLAAAAAPVPAAVPVPVPAPAPAPTPAPAAASGPLPKLTSTPTTSGSSTPQTGSKSTTTGGSVGAASTPKSSSSSPTGPVDDPALKQVAVPAVVGLAEEDARAVLEKAGLVANVWAVRNSAQPKGTVTEQDPRPSGTPLDRGAVVRLTVSSGKAEFPSVVGRAAKAAIAALKAAGFGEVEVAYVNDPSQAKGTVVSTEPGGGQVVPVNTAITVNVASGKVQVPDLVGLDTSAVQLRVLALGLRYDDTQRVESATVPQGQVISQEQAPDTLVETGTVVAVTVAARPAAAATEGQPTASPSTAPSREAGKATKKEAAKATNKDGASPHR